MTDRKLDEAISRWLEAEAPRQLPDRVLRTTFERTRRSRQQGGWRALPGRLSMPKFLPALGSATVIVVVAALAAGLYLNRPIDIGTASPTPTTTQWPAAARGMWPQVSLVEVHAAQDRADAGDPDYTWQVDPVLASYGGPDANGEPLEAEIFERFIREELRWEEFSGFAIHGYVPEGAHTRHLEGVLFLRCAPGRANPLYPEAYPEMPPEVRECAPTIDDSRYETVRFNVGQLARRGPSGIWVVTGWELLQSAEPGSFDDPLYPEFDQRPVEQVAPPSDAEVTALLEAFLGARVDGEAAESYLHRPDAEVPPSPDEEVPLLYATTAGSPYERSEFERLQGPVWPTGWFEFKVRMFAEDGTVVEQSFVIARQDGRLGLMYGSQTGDLPTTENGQSVPVPYSILDGEVTFAAAPPWGGTIVARTFTTLGGVGRGSAVQFTMLSVMADPGTGLGCEAGPPAADVDSLVQSIRSNPDFEATALTAATVGGIDALRMEVVGLRPIEVGDCIPLVLEHLPGGRDNRVHLYLLDLPEGMSARILVIAISAADSEFELVVEAAGPILDSFEFHAP